MKTSEELDIEKKYKSKSQYRSALQHKHLPEVPSAADFKKNGYKVGDMDDLLLRKIEELTLYTIEQQKQIQKLEERLADIVKSDE